ncbi:MAG: hypothetical protein K5898_00605 [Ruminococcus sp.]|uniref:hypothetical protein n=1 Tax=Ruminococcus sp. TaxID=41978 RepID=UPI0025DE12B0|nr:hypothetical protein [Ruminococcus sp.]MCR4793687.1 hypothetical protein [Ruminococcus sp.]
MHERLNNGFKFCFIANILFFAFGLICLYYYNTYISTSLISKTIEIIAYTVEIGGFCMFLWGDWLISTAMRFRNMMKICITVYIIIEATMMVLELNSYQLEFYQPYSLLLAMVHSAFSGLTCLTFLQLDPDKKKLEVFTIISIAIMFCGMLGNIIGYRIYFSIIVNSIAFAFMFFSVRWLIKREDIEVDCHGDKARVAEFTSKIVDD